MKKVVDSHISSESSADGLDMMQGEEKIQGFNLSSGRNVKF